MNDLAQRLAKDGYFRVELEGIVAGANAPESVRVPSVGGLVPMVIRDYVTFTGIGPNPVEPRLPMGAFDSYRGRLNDLLGVKYLAATGSWRDDIKDRLGPSYRVVADIDGQTVWENDRALPRLLRPE